MSCYDQPLEGDIVELVGIGTRGTVVEVLSVFGSTSVRVEVDGLDETVRWSIGSVRFVERPGSGS